MRSEEGRQYSLVAFDRPGKVAFAELPPRAPQMVAAEFLRRALNKLPHKAHTAWPTMASRSPSGRTSSCPAGTVLTGPAASAGRLVKPPHPWANGRGERMHRPLKEATVQPCHHAKRLKTLRRLPALICLRSRAKGPSYLHPRPTHHALRLYT